MPNKPYLSIILPAYNEAERLPKTLFDVDKTMSTKHYAYEIIVVSSGSTDNTVDIVRKLTTVIKNLKVIENTENMGKGGAVRQGMLTATGDIRLFMDSDNATTVDHFDRMEQYFPPREAHSPASAALQATYDVVICSRPMEGSKLDPPEPWYRQLPGKMGNLFWIQPLVLPGLWDTQCGFKAFTAACAEKVFALSRIGGWAFDVEILALAKKLGYHIKEVPVHWHHDGESKVTPAAYIKFFFEVAKIKWWLMRDAYGLKNIGNSSDFGNAPTL